jgi:hypothetical protein
VPVTRSSRALSFSKPEMAFDAEAVECEMCKPVSIDTDNLVEQLLRAARRGG